MKLNPTKAAARHQCDARRARGSAVILVVISLLLLVMMATAYLQTVRVQRFPEAEPRGAMDSVIESILRKIEGDIERSLYPEREEQFALHDYPWTNAREDLEDNEFWHVPFVWDDGDRWQHALLMPEDFGTGPYPPDTEQPFGGYQDRAWLAANEPWFDGDDDPLWSHLTNLTGVYLDYDRGADVFNVDGGVPVHHFVHHAGPEHRPSDLDPFNDFLFDATGDGIPDSRWTWAPLWRADGLVYVMAVRIVDLGGLVNANVALGLTDEGGDYDTTAAGDDAPRWAFPSEVDLGKFVFENSGGSADEAAHMDDLRNLLAYRFNTDFDSMPYRVSWDDPWGNRQDFWADWGKFANPSIDAADEDNYNRYGRSSEYRLRHRGGLARDAAPEAIERSADGMPTFLRADESGEMEWSQVDLTRYDFDDTKSDLRNFFELEPRHQMTTRSGAAIYAWPRDPLVDTFGDLGPGGEHVKVNLNDADPAAIAARIRAIYGENTPSTLPGGFSDVDAFADQLAASIADYADDDNRPTELNGHYGLEALPFITETYAQRRYQIETVDEDADPNEAIWAAVGNTGYAIEIRNPFRKPIDLEGVEVWVDGVEWGLLTDLTRIDPEEGPVNAGTPFEDMLLPDQVLVLHRSSNENNDSNNDHVADLVELDEDLFRSGEDMENVLREISTDPDDYFGLPFAPADLDWPQNTVPAGNESAWMTRDFEIELRIEASAGKVTYSKALGEEAPTRFTQVHPDDTDEYEEGDDGRDYWQHAYIGNGRGLNIIAVAHNLFDQETKWDEENDGPAWDRDDPYQGRSEAVAALGLVDKRDDGGPGDVLTDVLENQLLIRGSDEDEDEDEFGFMHVGELAHVAALGPTDGETIRERWNGATSVEGFMLDFVPSAENIDVENYNVPHAAMLMDQFTTFAPHEDDAQMVPGLVSLNTMPEHLLAKVLPIPDDDLREEVAWRIMTYRGDDLVGTLDMTAPTNDLQDVRAERIEEALGLASGAIDVTTVRAAPGIAHTGELFVLFNDILTTDNWGNYSNDVEAIEGTRVDFLANPANDEPDDIANDREEAMMIAKWLSQVGSTRSDYFAAHVVVRGYEEGGFEDDPYESRQFIAIFRRRLAEVDGEMRVTVDRVMPTGGPREREPYFVQ